MNTSFRHVKNAVCDRSKSLFAIERLPRRPMLQIIGLGLVSLNIYPVLAVQGAELKEPDYYGNYVRVYTTYICTMKDQYYSLLIRN